MTAISKGCIQPFLSRFYLEKIQNFFYTDRNMHPSGSPALSDYFFNGLRIFFRIQLFILFFITSWVGAFIAHSPFMLFFLIFHIFSFVCFIFAPIKTGRSFQNILLKSSHLLPISHVLSQVPAQALHMYFHFGSILI